MALVPMVHLLTPPHHEKIPPILMDLRRTVVRITIMGHTIHRHLTTQMNQKEIHTVPMSPNKTHMMMILRPMKMTYQQITT